MLDIYVLKHLPIVLQVKSNCKCLKISRHACIHESNKPIINIKQNLKQQELVQICMHKLNTGQYIYIKLNLKQNVGVHESNKTTPNQAINQSVRHKNKEKSLTAVPTDINVRNPQHKASHVLMSKD